MIVRFHRPFAITSGLVFLEGNIAEVPDDDGYRAVTAGAAIPGRRVKVKTDGLFVRNRTHAAGDVVDIGDFDPARPVASNIVPAITMVAVAPFTLNGEDVAKDSEFEVPIQTAPNLVARGWAEWKDDVTYPAL